MSTPKRPSGHGLGSVYLGFSITGPAVPDLTPTAPVYNRADLEATRAACKHGPYYVDAGGMTTCARCGACVPGGWTWQCLQGYQP